MNKQTKNTENRQTNISLNYFITLLASFFMQTKKIRTFGIEKKNWN